MLLQAPKAAIFLALQEGRGAIIVGTVLYRAILAKQFYQLKELDPLDPLMCILAQSLLALDTDIEFRNSNRWHRTTIGRYNTSAVESSTHMATSV